MIQNNQHLQNQVNLQLQKNSEEIDQSKLKLLNLKLLPDETILKGVITDVTNHLVTVKTRDGQVFNGKTLENALINIGEERTFTLNNKNGNVSLRLNPIDVKAQAVDKIVSALNDMGIKPTETSIQIAKALMQNNMALTEKNIAQIQSRVSLIQTSSNPDDAINKAMFMLKNDIAPTEKNVANLNALVTSDTTKQLQSVVSSFATLENKELAQKLMDIFNTSTTASTAEAKTTTQDTKNAPVAQQIAQEGQASDTLDDAIQNAPKQQVDGTTVANSNSKLENELEQLFAKYNTDASKEATAKEMATSKETVFDKLRDTISDKLVSTTLDFDKNGNLLEKTLGTKLGKPLDKLTEHLNLQEEMIELEEKLEKAMTLLNNDKSEASSKILKELTNVSEKLNFANDLKTVNYFNMPINMNNQDTSLTVNVFKESKNRKKGRDSVSALISLNTDNLGIFETYLQKNKSFVDIQFRLESETIENKVRQNIMSLDTLLKSSGFSLQNISFVQIGDKFSVLDDEECIEENRNFSKEPDRIVLDIRG